MQPAPTHAAVLPADWVQVLENIQSALNQALTETAERDEPLNEEIPVTPTAAEPGGMGGLAQLDQCLCRFQSSYQEAERHASEVEAELQVNQETIQHWLAAATALRHRLVNSPVSSIR
jgi:hypothetical protein